MDFNQLLADKDKWLKGLLVIISLWNIKKPLINNIGAVSSSDNAIRPFNHLSLSAKSWLKSNNS